MSRLKLYNRFRGGETKPSVSGTNKSLTVRESSSCDLAKRHQTPASMEKKVLMQSDSDATELKSKKPSIISENANDLVQAIDDQMSEELISKELSVSEELPERSLPCFDDGQASK